MINQFYTIAQSIYTYLYPKITNDTTKPTTNTQDPVITKMNPTMFFYDVETMRSIQFIPFIATTIPRYSELIPWSPTIINAAVKNVVTNGHPIAIFCDAIGSIVQNQNDAKALFLLTEVGPALFMQELLAQPGWLNSQEGCIRILRACLGDFSALVGMGILDSETEIVIQKALPGSEKKIDTPPVTPSNVAKTTVSNIPQASSIKSTETSKTTTTTKK